MGISRGLEMRGEIFYKVSMGIRLLIHVEWLFQIQSMWVGSEEEGGTELLNYMPQEYKKAPKTQFLAFIFSKSIKGNKTHANI